MAMTCGVVDAVDVFGEWNRSPTSGTVAAAGELDPAFAVVDACVFVNEVLVATPFVIVPKLDPWSEVVVTNPTGNPVGPVW